jgi:PAS domain-containing protein
MAYPIQIILTRQLAGYLSVPLFLVDPKGSLIFYNEPAEVLLGRRFCETGSMPPEEWATAFVPLDEEGQAVPPDALPLMITLKKQRPAHKRLQIRGLDGVLRRIEVASIPIAGLQGEFLGAAALFWELAA